MKNAFLALTLAASVPLAPLGAAAVDIGIGSSPESNMNSFGANGLDTTDPAMKACVAKAKNDYAPTKVAVVLDNDPHDVLLERYQERAGQQSLSAIISGSGGLRWPSGDIMEVSFICLLDPQGQAVFFHTQPLHRAMALKSCYRWADSRIEVSACLKREEDKAMEILNKVLAAARKHAEELDKVTKRTTAAKQLTASQNRWETYRATECARVGEMAAGGSGTGDFIRACQVDLTRARIDALMP